jgi:quercetin dioxygenase-like cupin family protein
VSEASAFPHLQQGSRPSQAQWQRANALARTETKPDECDKAVGEGTMRMTSRFVRQSAVVMGALTLMIRTPGQAQTEAPLHHHANEQITWITQGEAEVHSQGKKYVMHAGG